MADDKADSCDLLCLDLPVAEEIRARMPDARSAELEQAAMGAKALADPVRLTIAAALLPEPARVHPVDHHADGAFRDTGGHERPPDRLGTHDEPHVQPAGDHPATIRRARKPKRRPVSTTPRRGEKRPRFDPASGIAPK
ncbi:hypothetical protein [Streptomyces hainanensis]|uniref:Uncharacterized protein n=1 Tax=Streptomyces hainanensis TaxID=402648 RepID=A0A4R4TF85_9ACTN|nr:hypothetical protein [Streptomyces hainanensis]TDC76097.1 hypothetical protein E1283_10650 [Streptomyces hainanensis]